MIYLLCGLPLIDYMTDINMIDTTDINTIEITDVIEDWMIDNLC